MVVVLTVVVMGFVVPMKHVNFRIFPSFCFFPNRFLFSRISSNFPESGDFFPNRPGPFFSRIAVAHFSRIWVLIFFPNRSFFSRTFFPNRSSSTTTYYYHYEYYHYLPSLLLIPLLLILPVAVVVVATTTTTTTTTTTMLLLPLLHYHHHCYYYHYHYHYYYYYYYYYYCCSLLPNKCTCIGNFT